MPSPNLMNRFVSALLTGERNIAMAREFIDHRDDEAAAQWEMKRERAGEFVNALGKYLAGSDPSMAIEMPRERMALFGEIHVERQRQDAKYGGTEHDDTHVMNDWIALATRYAGEAAPRPACNKSPKPYDFDYFRKAMVRVAAIAVAAVEWHDRQRPF